jgi:inorganic triphosphatase YgiF
VTAPKEIELKLEVPPANLPRLAKIPHLRALKTPAKSATEISVYFDSKNRKLHKKGLMLRVRRVRDRYVQTIKSAGHSDLFERDEWESEIDGAMPDLRLAQGTALEPLLSRKFCRQLKPVFETRVRRKTYPLTDGDSDIALTVDRGEIDTGDRSKPLCEIELVLRRGHEAELFEVARELTHAVAGQLALKSKSERGYELLEGSEAAPVKAVPIDLSRGTSTRDAFKAIGLACLKQVIDNVPALLAGEPEGVHQMRVGLRRLRAAMSLFADILQDPQTAALKQELKWLTGELGPARELEVLVTRVVAPVKRRHSRLQGISSLSRDLTQQRAAARARAQDAAGSERFRALTLEIAGWLEAGQWRRPQDDLVRDRGDVPIEISAAEQLTRRFKKIRKKGKTLTRLDARSRHKLRIQAKKVRYASEFFAAVFPGKKASKRRDKFLSRLESVQDCLGDLNDIAVHENRITAIAGEGRRNRRRRGSPKRAFAAGLLTGREDARLDAVLQRATDAQAALARIKPFWR